MCDLCSRDERPEAEAANYVLGRGWQIGDRGGVRKITLAQQNK